MPDVKFCGMTRHEDARFAATLGARYVGVILTESPRRLDADAARAVFATLPVSVRRVGVFGVEPVDDIVDTAERIGLDVVQLHGEPDADEVARVQDRFEGEVWWVARVTDDRVPTATFEQARIADAIVLDARVDGKLGGTGVTLAWDRLREDVRRLRAARAPVILAGGLNPDNVARAVSTLRPDVVDVSSGVESAPGIKDHQRMRQFHDAARGGKGT